MKGASHSGDAPGARVKAEAAWPALWTRESFVTSGYPRCPFDGNERARFAAMVQARWCGASAASG